MSEPVSSPDPPPPTTVSIDSNVFGDLTSLDAKKIHDIFDNLSSCDVGKLVDLPQLIVVGQQSAGKSSVLEAISHIKFPISKDVCTRFATEIVLRRSNRTRAVVTVKFHDNIKSPEPIETTGFTEEDLPDIIQKAKNSMGLDDSKVFSKDILRIEIEGPDMNPLTLVDLPGLYVNNNKNQSERDSILVKEVVRSYMEKTNSISLVVVDASVNIVHQTALKMAKTIDPESERTVGIITKPDRSGEWEAEWIQVAKNQEEGNKLHLGWHVLRNYSMTEDPKKRDEVEALFFSEGDWRSVPDENKGVVELRKRLSSILFDHLKKCLPKVVSDIKKELDRVGKELSRLGQARLTDKDKRVFLSKTAGEFQRLARDGIYGRYSDSFFGELDDPSHKLRAELRNFGHVFDYTMRTKGSTRKIQWDRKDDDDNVEVAEDSDDEDAADYVEFTLSDFLERYKLFYELPPPEPIQEKDLFDTVQQLATDNQGCELPGTPNHGLILQLFQRQMQPWEGITKQYVEKVLSMAKTFVEDLFKHILGSSRTTENILSSYVDDFFNTKEKVLNKKIAEFISPYKHGFALPLDRDFQQTMASNVRKHGSQRDMENDRFGAHRVIEMMHAYYQVSSKAISPPFQQGVIQPRKLKGH